MNQFKSILLITSVLFISIFLSCSDKESVLPDVTPGIESAPNIILLIADDLGWDAFGDYPRMNGIKANTPTIDSLALNGISFLNFWTNPICAPTRASMLAGKYAFRTGVGGIQIPQEATLQSEETIIQKYISDRTSNEYASAVIGKWHVSSASDLNAPENFGIDYYAGMFLGAVPDYYDWTQTSAGIQENITTYATTHLVNQSVSWIEQQSKPFFLWLSFNAPHTPFHLPPSQLISDQSLTDNQAAIDADPLPYYLASIETMDKEIARLISSLSPEQQENTVFIFLGDNGTPVQVSQTPYAANRVKGKLFQGGINTPLIISGKNISRKNVTEIALVQAPDMFATIADLAGAGDDNYQDGMSLKPLLTDAEATKRTFTYSEQFGSTNMVNDGYTIRNEEYKLIHLDSGTEYFYQLSTDPFEENDLLSETLSAEAQQNLDEIRQIKTDL
jgi:arylsulfatase B